MKLSFISLIWYLIFYINFSYCQIQLEEFDSEDEEQAVKKLFEGYNKNHRPFPISNITSNGTVIVNKTLPTEVSVTLHIVSFSTMSVQNMDFTVDIYLRMIWTDHRLMHRSLNRDLSIHNQKNLIWMPDVFFRNGKEVSAHDQPIPNILVKLQPSGRVYFSQKLTARLSCVMDLRDFPMDCQTCRIEMGTYGSSLNEVKFVWHSINITMETDAMQIAEFSEPTLWAEKCTKSFAVTGEFACLRAMFMFRRNYGFYIMNTYVPFILMVCISWISFWIDVRVTPARVTIAFLTVLAVVTQNAGTQMTGMPRVSYVKAIDLFMMASLIFVIGALMEFAAASFLVRQWEKTSVGEKRHSSMHDSIKKTESTALHNGELEQLNDEEPKPRRRRIEGCYRNPKVNRLDYCSRFAFPTMYFVFQALYWAYFLQDREQCANNHKYFIG